MPDLLDRLKAALADRYRVDREIGRGGMATVYLAEDLKHHRPVALKVLRPELAAALGLARRAAESSAGARVDGAEATTTRLARLRPRGERDGYVLLQGIRHAEQRAERDVRVGRLEPGDLLLTHAHRASQRFLTQPRPVASGA